MTITQKTPEEIDLKGMYLLCSETPERKIFHQMLQQFLDIRAIYNDKAIRFRLELQILTIVNYVWLICNENRMLEEINSIQYDRFNTAFDKFVRVSPDKRTWIEYVQLLSPILAIDSLYE